MVLEIHFIDGPTVILLVSGETHRESSSEERFRGSKRGKDPLNFASILVSILMLHGQTGCDFSKSSGIILNSLSLVYEQSIDNGNHDSNVWNNGHNG